MCSGCNGCVIDQAKTYWLKPKPTSFMFINLKGLEFRQGTTESLSLSMVSETSAGRLEGWGWNDLKTSSLTCLVVDAGWRTQFTSMLSLCLGCLDFQNKNPKERRIPPPPKKKAVSVL